ncbi:MAG TPA: PEGA domain-containing protein [Bdellovibrionota bacterium]|nr:PEGA domain-containing protein [Bdellovibrionota bacterium]
MGKQDLAAWVLFYGVDRNTFARIPALSLCAGYSGQMLDDAEAPGTLMGFPNAVQAARAALRCHPELMRALPEGSVPPMVIDTSGDSKRMATVAFGMPAGTIAVTENIARWLAGEPLELLPGPRIRMEGERDVPVRILNLSSHNMGWALPTIPTAFPPSSPPYLRRTEPAVINIQMAPKRSWPKIPWRILFILAIGVVFVFGALASARLLTRRLRAARTGSPEPQAQTSSEISFVEAIPTPTPTPIPLGFGTVVIQTTPPAAKVYLNDELVGKKSPVVLSQKSNQETYKLTVEAKGYDTHTSLFNVDADQRKVIDIRLAKQVPK